MYIVGGRNKKNAERLAAHEGFDEGLVLSLDENGEFRRIELEYGEMPDARPPGIPSVHFAAASLMADRLYLCTQTEVLVYRVPEFRRLIHLSLPCFNDLHHVVPSTTGTLYVADTGLDAVLEITEAGEVLHAWDLSSGSDPWTRFPRSVDYRTVATTQPHRVHPNYVFLAGEEVWATRLEQQDAIRLVPPGARIPIGIERPHDGIVSDGKVYFTIVDGHVVQADPRRCAVERVYDLQEIFRSPYPLGWCRGLKLLDPERMIVGFTRLRPTRFKENIRWVRRRLKQALGWDPEGEWGAFPTRVACVDLARHEVVWETDIESYGMNAVFSIL